MGADFAAERLDYLKGGIDGSVTNNVDVPQTDGIRLWVNRSLDSQHPEWGGRDFIMAMAFDAYGDLWVGSYFNGIARVKMKGSFSTAKSQADVDYWANRSWAKKPAWGDAGDYVWTLAGDPDGSVWIGGGQNAWRFVAATGQTVSYGSVIPGQNVNQISFDPRPGKRAVVFATDSGAFVYRGK
jgi:ligand-binding sensor domain-containing protein